GIFSTFTLMVSAKPTFLLMTACWAGRNEPGCLCSVKMWFQSPSSFITLSPREFRRLIRAMTWVFGTDHASEPVIARASFCVFRPSFGGRVGTADFGAGLVTTITCLSVAAVTPAPVCAHVGGETTQSASKTAALLLIVGRGDHIGIS